MITVAQHEHDVRTLDNIRERSVARIREIDAVLGELQPLFSRLMNERDECLAITRRTGPNVLGQMAEAAGAAFATAMTPNVTSDPARDLGKVAGRAEAHKY